MVYESFWVCGTCFRLHGTEGDRRQLCRCASPEEHDALGKEAYQRDGSYWTQLAEICRCCGAEVVEARYKFAKWFCPTCFTRASEVNKACGRCAIPVGWHSIINGVFIRFKRCKTLPGATAAADELVAFFQESADMGTWGRSVVESHWKRAELPIGETVPAGRYLDAVWATGVDKSALFQQLVSARGGQERVR